MKIQYILLNEELRNCACVPFRLLTYCLNYLYVLSILLVR